MGIATEADLTATGRMFHALSDPTRIEIMQILRRGEHCVCELTEHLDCAQSRLSFHLKTLKGAGLVSDRKDGRWVYYQLNPKALQAMAEFANEMADVTPGRHCCGG